MDSFKNYLNEKRFGGDTNIPASPELTKHIESGKAKILINVPSALHPSARFLVIKNPKLGDDFGNTRANQDKVVMTITSDPKRGRIKMFSFHGTHVSHQRAMDFAKKHKLVAMKDKDGNPLYAKESVELDEAKSPVKSLGKEAKAVLAMALNMSAKGSGAVAHDNNLEYFTPDAIDAAIKFLDKNSKKLTPAGRHAAREIVKTLGESYTPEHEYEEELNGRNIGEGFASHAQRRAAFASGYEAKGKKGKKEDVELDELGTAHADTHKIKKTKDGYQLFVYKPTMGKFVEQGKPQKTERAAEKYAKRFESVEVEESVQLDEMDAAAMKRFYKEVHAELKKVMDNKYYREFQSSNGGQALDNVINHFGKSRGYRVDKTVKSIIDKYGKNRDEYVKLSFQSAAKGRIREEVEPIEEMSAKKHYEKMIQQDKLGGKRVSPIDRKRFPNREREGLEGPYRNKKSGLIYYYDKKAGKYYDTQTDMYLDVKDVMDSVDMSAVRNFLDNRK